MRFFVVFAALIVAACALPTREFIPVLDSDVDVSAWTLSSLSAAIQDPNTPPQLVPYLTEALNNLMAEIFAGNPSEVAIVVTPVGLLDEVNPSPVSVVEHPAVETPVAPVVTPVAPVETPVAPVEAPVASAQAPLVQLIVNVNAAASAPAPVAPVNPAPVAPVNPIAVSPVVVAPAPVVNPVDVIAVNPIAPAPVEVNPVDVIAVMPMPNPVDVIAISPPDVNPIDVIAVSAPEVNPVDIANPLPVAPVGAVGVVGPLL